MDAETAHLANVIRHHREGHAARAAAPVMAHGVAHSQASSSVASFDPETFPLEDAKADAAAAVEAERCVLHRRLAAATQALDEERRTHDHDGRLNNHRLASLHQIDHLNDELSAAREAASHCATSDHRRAPPEQNGNRRLASSSS
jgi:hypothetical protein